MTLTRFFPCVLSGAVLALALSFGLSGRVVAQQVGQTGVFSVIWANDPRPGSTAPAERLYFLTDNQGHATRLRLTDAQLAPFGGYRALLRKRVRVDGDRSPAALGVPASRTPELNVRILQPLEALAPVGKAALQANAIAGSRRYVTILCSFPDIPSLPNSVGTYQAWNTSATGPSLPDYWHEVSGGLVDLSGSMVVGWLPLPNMSSYYGITGLAGLNVDLQGLAADCTGQADSMVDFTQFAGINLQFNANLNGFSNGGPNAMFLDGQLRFYSMTWLSSWADMSIYAHEEGHGYGLPHSSGPYTQIYDSRWDVMSAGNQVRHPMHTIVYHKDLLGWIPTAREYLAPSGASSASIVLDRVEPSTGTDYLAARIPIPGPNGQFYTVEARQRVSYDSVVPGDAVVIHKVDPTRTDRDAQVVDPDLNGDPNDAGSMWLPGETFTDAVANVTVRVDSATATGYGITITTGATPPTRKLVVQLSGGGTVTSAPLLPASINCPGVCSASYTDGQVVTLAYAVVGGVAFGGWGGDCAGSGLSTCSLVMNTDRNVTATFQPGHLLTLQVVGQTGLVAGNRGGIFTSPGAINCQSSVINCSGTLLANSQYAIGAYPEQVTGVQYSGWAFSSWSGDCTGTQSCDVIMSQDRAVTATFVVGPVIQAVRVGNGTIFAPNQLNCQTNYTLLCRVPFPMGAQITPLAFPDPGWAFAGWDISRPGFACIGYSPCTVTMPPNLPLYATTVKATFVQGIALGLARPGGAMTAVAGGAPVPGSIAVMVNGTGSSSVPWTAAVTGGQTWLTVTSPTGTGSRSLIFTANPSTLAPGTYIGQITVTGSGVATPPATYADTLVVLGGITLAVAPSLHHDTLAAGATTSHPDSALITLGGTGAGGLTWTATHRPAASWLSITNASGQGTGWLHWTRSAAGLAAGVRIDTIVVAVAGASGSPATILDSFVVVAPLTLTLAPASRLDSAAVGSTTSRPDSATVTLSGLGAGNSQWTATHGGGSWLMLTTAGGQGSGRLRWTRDPTGLAVGTYVDTMTVAAAGAVGSPLRLLDTLRILGPLTISLSPGNHRDSLPQGSSTAKADTATVTFAGFGGGTAAWSATHSTAVWLTLTTPNGQGAGKLRWSVSPTGLASGLYVDTITVTAAGAIGSPLRLLDTLRVYEPPIDLACAEGVLLTGATCLGPTERGYLDATGNHDQTYNLGDLLAYLDRKALTLSPPALAALLAAESGSGTGPAPRQTRRTTP